MLWQPIIPMERNVPGKVVTLQVWSHGCRNDLPLWIQAQTCREQMQKVSLIHGSSLIILHTVICFACRFRWRLSQLFYNVFWAMLSCWWRFDFFKYLKRWITSRGCWKKWWDNVQGPFCKLQWNHYPRPPPPTPLHFCPLHTHHVAILLSWLLWFVQLQCDYCQ